MTGPSFPVSVGVDCPAKTNLTLRVGQARAEWGNRHALDTIYCAVSIYDTVTATRKAPGTGFSLDLSGTHLGDLAASGTDMRRNHAVLALFAMAEASGREPDVALTIDKRIPVGAGLGGGSADAAATLLALNTLWGLDWPLERLREVAAGLGADMPFCLSGGYAHGTGFGERITTLEEDRIRQLRDSGFAGPLVVARPRSTRPSTSWAATPTMTTICSAPPSRCIRAAVRPCAPRCRPAPRMPSSPVPAPRWWRSRPTPRDCRRLRTHGASRRPWTASSPRTPRLPQRCTSIPHSPHQRQPLTLWW